MKLFNTMTRKVEELQPLEPDKVKFYTCGLTVYNHPSIGNWQGYIYWDVLIRALKAEGYVVERTQNITDVGHLVSDDDSGEDKLEVGARREGKTAWDVAKKYTELTLKEAGELNLITPDHLVPATSCIPEQISFAQALDTAGFLYETPDGMYFDTSKVAEYGKLARLDIDGLDAGARVEMAGKKNPTDFAVWKFSPKNAQRDMEWDSPWGKGFPGWHLECSVIARETLGDQIDIHAGGIDHIPVHHTNEIAQTESLTGKPFSQFWIHNNHIKVDGRKMSKSLGNVYTLKDITARGFSLDAFRMLTLEKHYQTEGNFTWEILSTAQNRLNNWRNIAALRHQIHTHDDNAETFTFFAANQALLEALSDNLNTPRALAIVNETFDAIVKQPPRLIDRHSLVSFLERINELLAINLLSTTPDITDDIKQKIIERERARDAKDWQASDKLREQLIERGIAVRDTSHGQIWSYA